jgi:hypothetical protein
LVTRALCHFLTKWPRHLPPTYTAMLSLTFGLKLEKVRRSTSFTLLYVYSNIKEVLVSFEIYLWKYLSTQHYHYLLYHCSTGKGDADKHSIWMFVRSSMHLCINQIKFCMITRECMYRFSFFRHMCNIIFESVLLFLVMIHLGAILNLFKYK